MGPIHLPAAAPVLPLGEFAAESAVECHHHLSLVERGAVLEWVLSGLEGTSSSREKVDKPFQRVTLSAAATIFGASQKARTDLELPPEEAKNAHCYKSNLQAEKVSHLTF